MSKQITVKLSISPKEKAHYTKVAKLAGVTLTQVINVVLALYSTAHDQKEEPK
jgi:hypothetical protein